jgi:hypothetical protein
MALRDELLALRENTAQVYGHAEALRVQWQEIEKAQAQLYQVSDLTQAVYARAPDANIGAAGEARKDSEAL